MAKNKNKRIKIFTSFMLALGIIGICSSISIDNIKNPNFNSNNTNNSNSSNSSTITGSNSSDSSIINPTIVKNGWHLVNNLNDINDGDYITFASGIEKGNLFGEYNSSVKRFDLVKDFTYSQSVSNYIDNGTFSDITSSFNYFEVDINENGYSFIDDGQYLTSAYSSSNTCKLSTILNEYSTFNITFIDDYVLCVSGGDKKCNTIKFSSSYFSLYENSATSLPYMYKWYGDEEINNEPLFSFDISEYEIVQPEDLYLEVGMSFLPVLELDGKTYTISHGNSIAMTTCEFLKTNNTLLSNDSIISLDIVENTRWVDEIYDFEEVTDDKYFSLKYLNNSLNQYEYFVLGDTTADCFVEDGKIRTIYDPYSENADSDYGYLKFSSGDVYDWDDNLLYTNSYDIDKSYITDTWDTSYYLVKYSEQLSVENRFRIYSDSSFYSFDGECLNYDGQDIYSINFYLGHGDSFYILDNYKSLFDNNGELLDDYNFDINGNLSYRDGFFYGIHYGLVILDYNLDNNTFSIDINTRSMLEGNYNLVKYDGDVINLDNYNNDNVLSWSTDTSKKNLKYIIVDNNFNVLFKVEDIIFTNNTGQTLSSPIYSNYYGFLSLSNYKYFTIEINLNENTFSLVLTGSYIPPI